MSFAIPTRQRVTLTSKESRIEHVLDRFGSALESTHEGLPADVERLLGDIHENIFDPGLTVKEVRARCRIGNHNISTRFRRIFGRDIRSYIESLRMEAAARLLAEERDIEIFLIAVAVGYEHQETFCRAFLRYFERTPTKFRSQAQKSSKTEARTGGETSHRIPARGLSGTPQTNQELTSNHLRQAAI